MSDTLRLIVEGRRLLAKASAGEWSVSKVGPLDCITPNRENCLELQSDDESFWLAQILKSANGKANADFMVFARNNLEAILDALELQSELKDDKGNTITELCNTAWQHVYGDGRNDWQYPAMAIRHLCQYADEQKTAAEQAAAAERARIIAIIRTGVGCDVADHQKGLCECGSLVEAIEKGE